MDSSNCIRINRLQEYRELFHPIGKVDGRVYILIFVVIATDVTLNELVRIKSLQKITFYFESEDFICIVNQVMI